MLIEPGSTLLMTGDSITDCGRRLPVGRAADGGLGDGYVSLVHALLEDAYPDHHIEVLNTGVGGDTVMDLEARWDRDVLAHRPGWLSVMIGINDVWRLFGTPALQEWHVPLPAYRSTLEGLVARARPQVRGLVLMSPYYLQPDPSDPMREMMDSYGEAVRQIAGRQDALFVDTQAAFDAVMKTTGPLSLSEDRVHPNRTGHMVLAQAFLEAVGFEGGWTD